MASSEGVSFGEWLHQQRRMLDLTQQEFADQVGCARITLRRIESGALKPSKELTQILLEKLGIPENERPQWVHYARGLSDFPARSVDSSASKLLTNLPASLTSFIGREKEQAEILKLISKYRLVTLVGPGGVGKTRLSLVVGGQALGDYAHGIWVVELAPLLDPLLVPRTTAITVGLRDEPRRPVIDMLSDYLHVKNLLIILDNCEHLLDACAQLADALLKKCLNLKILATSREALGILGEASYRVPSLRLPDMQQVIEKFRDYESVRLFEERAQLAQMDFLLTMENASAVAKICTQLDGIPLAIELAAARVNMFSTEQIAARLQESFNLLTTGNRTALPRHQTLQAAIDWSYNLLSPTEQILFRRLSVFVNGWTLEAAKSICSDADIRSEDIFDLLTQLINKSLVNREELQSETRYRILETIRQYANMKLVESNENDMLRNLHLNYFLNLAETAEPHLIRPEQLEWLAKLDADYENLRLALEWALGRETAKPSQNLCGALSWFWEIRCYWLEGLTWVKRALAKPYHNKSKSENAARARALYTYAQLEWQLGNFEKMLSPAQESLALASEALDKKDIAIARFCVGNALRLRGGDDELAQSLLEQSFAEFQALDEPFWQMQAFIYLGSPSQAKVTRRLELARKAGERLSLADALTDYAGWLFGINRIQEATNYAEESDRLYKQIGSSNISVNSLLFAEIAWNNGDFERARSLYMDLQERFNLLGESFWKARCMENLGRLAMEEGNLHEAKAFLEQALIIKQEIGYKPVIASCLLYLSNLLYLQGDLEKFKQSIRESLSFRTYFDKTQKVSILMIILGSPYLQKPESVAQLSGAIDLYKRNSDFAFRPLDQRYGERAETHARKLLGDVAFEAAFTEGQKMSLEEALDLTLKTIEQD